MAAITTSTTQIDYCDDVTFKWTIKGSLDEIKTLTGRSKIISENFKSDDESQNAWQLTIEEIISPIQCGHMVPCACPSHHRVVKINLNLVESPYPFGSKIKYKCDCELAYDWAPANRPEKTKRSLINLIGSELTIPLYSLYDRTFRDLSNVTIKCRIQSDPQMVIINEFGKKAWEIQNSHGGSVGNNLADTRGVRILSKILEDYPEDVEIICKGAKFKIHKHLLTAQSEVFARMFEVNLTEKQKNRIVIEEFEPEIVQVFLNYLKNMSNSALAEINENEKMRTGLFMIAHKYEVDDLKTHCEVLLCRKINLLNAFEMLELGKLYDLSELEETAMKFILSQKRSPEILKAFDRLAVENPKLFAEIQAEFWKNY